MHYRGSKKTLYILAIIVILLPRYCFATALTGTSKSTKEDSVAITGVSFSGGGALGFCYIGVLDVLDSFGIKIDCITGSSIGSLIAVLYANGYTAREILGILKEEHIDNLCHIYRPNLYFSGGLVDTRHLQRILAKYLKHNSFDSLQIKFYCCVTDMNTNKPHYISTGGNLVQYVIASLAVPGIFAPVMIDSIYYFDGGTNDMLPVAPLFKENCTRRIGVFPIMEKEKNIEQPNFLWIRAYTHIYYMQILRNKDAFTDIIAIDPINYGVLSFKKMSELTDIGRKVTWQYLHQEKRIN